jgi:thiol-disulfide isomerase/thioredoxin
VRVKSTQTVALLLFGGLVSCSTPKERPAGSVPAPVTSVASAPDRAPPPPKPAPAAAASSAEPSPLIPVPSKTGSAYIGCGEPIPPAQLWDETTESQVLEAIGEAKACAAQNGRRLLLEFVAPWCADCQEMAKLEAVPSVEETLRRRFERVRINIGKWDRHEALRENFGVRALATYIVLEPKTSKLLAKTTLEPITKRGPKLSAADWQRWLEAH